MLIDEIISNRIKNIYRSKNVMYSFFLEGLGNLESYHYVLELDNNKKYEFYFDYICYWSGEQPLTEIETSDDIWFKNKLITDVITDNENSYFFFKLENPRSTNRLNQSSENEVRRLRGQSAIPATEDGGFRR